MRYIGIPFRLVFVLAFLIVVIPMIVLCALFVPNVIDELKTICKDSFIWVWHGGEEKQWYDR